VSDRPPKLPTLRARVAELHPSRRVAWALFFAACLVVTLLHLFVNGASIDHKELWIDEASTYLVARYPVARIVSLSIEFHSQPPLYYLLLHFVTWLGSGELLIRGFCWLLCLGYVAFVMLELNELGVAARLGLCLLFIVNPHTRFLSHELRPYALSALSTFVASVLFLRLLRRPRDARLALGYLLAAWVMVYALAFDVWTMAAHGLFGGAAILVMLPRRGLRETLRTMWPIVLTLATLAALYLPYLLYVLAHEPPSGAKPALSKVLSEAVAFEHHASAVRRFTDLPGKPAFALQVLALFGVLRRLLRKDGQVLFWALLFFGQVAFCYGFMLGKIPVAFRYLTPAFPALLMSMAIGFDAVVGPRLTRLAVPALLLVGIGLIATTAGPFRDWLRAPVPATNWRRLAAELAKIPGEKGLFFDNGHYAQMLEYAARDDRSLRFFTHHYEDIPGTGMSAGGDFMTGAYIEQVLAEHAGETRCFFYSRDKRGARKERNRPVRVYEESFVPAMARLGYQEAFKLESGKIPDPFHDYFLITGFCRP